MQIIELTVKNPHTIDPIGEKMWIMNLMVYKAHTSLIQCWKYVNHESNGI